jgi:DNA uptake protein ComE-like DNA-binding protein
MGLVRISIKSTMSEKQLLSSRTDLQELLSLAPDWKPVLDSVVAAKKAKDDKSKDISSFELLERLGAKAIFMKAQTLGPQQAALGKLLRDHYFQPMLTKMLGNNQNLKRFWAQRRHPLDWQKNQAVSMAVELAVKLEGVLSRHLAAGHDDGFKVLLAAYVQRSVQNAVVDYIKEEWQWEKETLQDLNLDPEMEDPRQAAPDDIKYAPEHQAISGEQVAQLNQLREELSLMLADKNQPKDALTVVDCMFGLGLTEKSKLGVELTMREVCDVLALAGETQARKIARCQVLLDKGLDIIRNQIRNRLPGVAQCWQTDINVNTASRRELSHLLSLTEGEVDRLIAGRQYYSLDELADNGVIKPARLSEIAAHGAVAAFVPLEVNASTNRDLIDILGFSKEAAQKFIAKRPYASFEEAIKSGHLDKATYESALKRGAVIKAPSSGERRLDINSAKKEELLALGLSSALCDRVHRGRPFTTWAELDEYLALAAAAKDWQILRQKTCLGISD